MVFKEKEVNDLRLLLFQKTTSLHANNATTIFM